MVKQPFVDTIIHSDSRSNSINAAMVLGSIKEKVTGDFSRQIEPVIALSELPKDFLRIGSMSILTDA